MTGMTNVAATARRAGGGSGRTGNVSEEKPDRRVGVLVIHGINTGAVNYSEEFRVRLKAELKSLGLHEPHDVCIEEVFWASITKSTQSEFKLNSILFFPHIEREAQRAFVIEALGDAAAYQNVRPNPIYLEPANDDGATAAARDSRTVYERVQDRVADSMASLRARLDANSPIVIVAHSFGGWIASSYVDDVRTHCGLDNVAIDRLDINERARAKRRRSLSPLEKFETLGGIVTIGCNIPIFAFSQNPDDVKPVDLPGNLLRKSKEAEAKCKWLNFYNRHDILSFPLGAINQRYNDGVTDKEIEIKGLPRNLGWMSAAILSGGSLLSGLVFLSTFVLIGGPKELDLFQAIIIFAAILMPMLVALGLLWCIHRYSPLFDFQTPHVGYWTNTKVISETAELIRGLSQLRDGAVELGPREEVAQDNPFGGNPAAVAEQVAPDEPVAQINVASSPI